MKWKSRYIRYKRIRRRLVRFSVFGVFSLLTLAYLVFKSSAVQTYLTNQIGGFLSEKTNSKITVEEVDFQPIDLFILKGLLVLDHHDDTLLYSKEFYLEIDDYDLDKKVIELGTLELEEAQLDIRKYKGEETNNFKHFLNGLKSKKARNDSAQWSFFVGELELENLAFQYWDENTPVKSEGIDFRHIDLKRVAADIDNFVFHEGLVSVNIDMLSFVDRSGFNLIGLQGNIRMDNHKMVFRDFELETPESDLNGRIQMEYNGFKDFKEFVTNVELLGKFEETTISGKDIAYFAPKLTGLNRKLDFKGEISGTIDDLKAKDLKFSYGENTEFSGNVTIKGLKYPKDAIIEAEVNDLVTFERDVKTIPLPPFKSRKTLKTPKWMTNIGQMGFKGQFKGAVRDFEAFGVLTTTAGEVRTDVSLKTDTNNTTRISGSVMSDKFDLGQTLGKKSLGNISLRGELDALTKEKDFRLQFSGGIPRFDFRGYSYTNIHMDGEIRDKVFSGKLGIKDTNLVFDFDGEVDFSQPSQQRYDFVADLKKVNLRKVNWMNRDSSAQVSGKINIALTGNNLEDMNGVLRVDDIVWREKGELYKLDSLKLRSVKQKNREMMLLNSDLFTGKIEGDYNLKDIYPTVMHVFSKEIPSLISHNPNLKINQGQNKFRLMFKMYDYQMINELFTPNFNLADNSRFSGRFDDTDQSFLFQFASDSLQIGKRRIEDIKLYGKNKGEGLFISAKTSFAQLFDTVGIKQLVLKSDVKSNVLDYSLAYDNQSKFRNYGEIKGEVDLNNLDSLKMRFNESKIVFRDTIWRIDTSNHIVLADEYIKVDDFKFFSQGQYLTVNGVASRASRDYMKVDMENFSLGKLKYFWDRLKIDLEGDATGQIIFRGIYGRPVFTAGLDVNRMKLNNQRFGKVDLRAGFIPEEKRIDIELSVDNTSRRNKFKTLELRGGYYPFENGRIDMTASLKNMQLKFLEKYFAGVFSDFKRGKTSGDLKITGTAKYPEVVGKVRVDQFNLKLDYLNVVYAIDAQELEFKKDSILFDDFTLSHNKWTKSKARVNGLVTHTGFKNFKYSMDSVFLRKFYCLNTTVDENPTYYGQAFVDGLIHLRGDGTTNYIGGSVSTVPYKDKFNEGRSELVMPLDQTQELELSEFVSFVDLNDTSKEEKKRVEEEMDLTGMELDFNFEINDDALVRIIFDPTIGDEIKVTGNGVIGMQINTNGKFQMYGDYEVQEGNYYFTIQKILGKRFAVEPGSKMSWDGDPLDASLDMKTYYRTRGNLIDLVDSSTVANYTQLRENFDRRIVVNAEMFLSGSLWKPDINIGISLPNGTPEEKTHLETYIVGDNEINKQFFSLMTISQFIPPVNQLEALAADGGLNQGLQVVEGQLNNALSGLMKGVDLGVDYNTVSEEDAGQEGFNDEVRLLAGFQYKKFKVNTDYDINNQVGDIEAEFKITNNLRAKAYHKKTREDPAINSGSTTTFGLGAAYQKSFNSFRDIFRREGEE